MCGKPQKTRCSLTLEIGAISLALFAELLFDDQTRCKLYEFVYIVSITETW